MKAIPEIDCRVFKRYIAFRPLRESFSSLSERNTTIRIDTIYGLRDVGRGSDYRSVLKDITCYYELCANKHHELEKSRYFMGSERPEDLNAVRDKLLRSAMFDEETVQNEGISDVQPCLLLSFRRRRPQIYAQKWHFSWRLKSLQKRSRCTTRTSSLIN